MPLTDLTIDHLWSALSEEEISQGCIALMEPCYPVLEARRQAAMKRISDIRNIRIESEIEGIAFKPPLTSSHLLETAEDASSNQRRGPRDEGPAPNSTPAILPSAPRPFNPSDLRLHSFLCPHRLGRSRGRIYSISK
jgi:hypothetical protein